MKRRRTWYGLARSLAMFASSRRRTRAERPIVPLAVRSVAGDAARGVERRDLLEQRVVAVGISPARHNDAVQRDCEPDFGRDVANHDAGAPVIGAVRAGPVNRVAVVQRDLARLE